MKSKETKKSDKSNTASLLKNTLLQPIKSEERSLTFCIENNTFNQEEVIILDLQNCIKGSSKCKVILCEEEEISAINRMETGQYIISGIRYIVNQTPFKPNEQFSYGAFDLINKPTIGVTETRPMEPLKYKTSYQSMEGQIDIILHSPLEYKRGMHFKLSILPKTTVTLIFMLKNSK